MLSPGELSLPCLVRENIGTASGNDVIQGMAFLNSQI
jgi:hypothetical protein